MGVTASAGQKTIPSHIKSAVKNAVICAIRTLLIIIVITF